MVGTGLGYIRNLSRNPGYGLHRRRREYGHGDRRPLGPKLVRGRGLRRRARPTAAHWWALFVVILVAGLLLIELVRFML